MKESRKEQALSALLAYPTIKAAAKAADIGERTLYRYMREPEFMEEYRERRRQLLDAAAGALTSNIGHAITALLEITVDKRASKLARVQAARTVLEYSLKLFEETDISDRLTALEKAANGDKRQSEPNILDGL